MLDLVTFADENGNFLLNNIPYGLYDAVVNLDGYASYKQRLIHEGNTSLGANGIFFLIYHSKHIISAFSSLFWFIFSFLSRRF